MAVKEALLGIMTLGSAYGLQLHAELGIRAPHRAKTNVGQVYGTLDRCVTAGLVSRDGQTRDGFPLYTLTSAGQSVAQEWLYGLAIVTVSEWNDMQDHILIARSVDTAALESVIGVYENILTRAIFPPGVQARGEMASPTVQRLNAAAESRFADACLAWLGDVRREMTRGPAADAPHGYQTDRNKRGRPSENEGLVKKGS